ncbi:Hpt domain-containing protein [Fulvimarina endophytica]|nr:Hpt domain-containing protein [Fulvimarina endophytica]
MSVAARLSEVAEPTIRQPVAPPSSGRPIDLVHLARQTCGDRALERSVLSMLARQIEAAETELRRLPASERAPLVHGLKGTARNVGAFTLADAAADLEAGPASGERFDALIAAMVATRLYAAALV